MSRILVVEDDERIRSSMRLALEDEGYTGRGRRRSGEEAVDRFTDEPAELVLIDLMLPGIDGFETCRTSGATSTVPIIMVTARIGHPRRGGRARSRSRRLRHQAVRGQGAGGPDPGPAPPIPPPTTPAVGAQLR